MNQPSILAVVNVAAVLCASPRRYSCGAAGVFLAAVAFAAGCNPSTGMLIAPTPLPAELQATSYESAESNQLADPPAGGSADKSKPKPAGSADEKSGQRVPGKPTFNPPVKSTLKSALKPAAPRGDTASPAEQGGKPDTSKGSSTLKKSGSSGATSDKSSGPAGKSNAKGAGTNAGKAAGTESAPQGATRQIPLFEGWPKPALALVLTGRQNGYIEPCGCTGLANQKGGLSRRQSLFKQLSDRGWPILPLDVGNQVKRFGRQSEIKFQIANEGLKRLGYQAVGIGPDDLRLSSGELLSAIAEEPQRFVSANAAVLDRDATPRFLVVEAGGKKVGVTACLGDAERKKLQSDELALEPAADGLKVAAKALAAQECDLQLLLAFASIDETRKLARQFPQFQVVVTSGGAEEPAFEPEVIEGTSTRLIQVGAKGMYVGVLGLFDDARNPLRFQRVPLDDRFADSAEMLQLLAAYQDQLRDAGLDMLVTPQVHPVGGEFVGTESCAGCHTKAYEVWKNSDHAHATDSLIKPGERSEIARHFDPECLSCHVTGWDPQRFAPFKTGYLSLERTAALKHNGCENCHGPGAAHAAAESGDKPATPAMLTKLRASMRLPLAKARDKCLECHDLDNSPAFQKDGAFDKYWKAIAHPGKD